MSKLGLLLLDEKTRPMELGKKRVNLAYNSSVFIMEGSQDRNMEAGDDTEAMEAYCLLACSLWLAQPAFL